MKAVIMAGGKGTRLLELTNDEIPKPMAPLLAKPILQYQVDCLKKNGITQISIITGHLGEKIVEYFEDGSKFGVSITYFNETEPLGTAGGLKEIAEFLGNEPFLLVFGDVIFDIDITRMINFHNNKSSKATLFVHPNSHPFDSDLVRTDADGRITGFDSKRNVRNYYYKNCVNAGFYILSHYVTNKIEKGKKTDLEHDILLPMVNNSDDIFAYQSSEYIKDVGTVDRILHTEQDIKNGIVECKNLSRKQKCIFLDRDGVVNVYKGLISSPDEFELYPNTIDAIKLINKSEYIAVLVTNQPVIARGLTTLDELDEIHNKMQTELGKGGAYLDAVYFCPHHPDKGYPEELPEYKIECDCRKPKPGMFFKAAQDFNIDLEQSWMIGDTRRDIMAGKNAGTKTILVATGEAGTDKGFDVQPDAECKDILDAVIYILNNRSN